LSNTDFRRWAAIRGYAGVLTGEPVPPHIEHPLTEPERAAIEAGRVPAPAALGSALFRRLRVLGDTSWLTVRRDGPTGIRVTWAGGRTAAEVAVGLVHPLAGLPGDRFLVVPAVDGAMTVTALDTTGALADTTLVLRQAPLNAAAPERREDTTAAWTAFTRALAAPNPSRPRTVDAPTSTGGAGRAHQEA
jgi:hypothetical protein